jgi:hypothetical protein
MNLFLFDSTGPIIPAPSNWPCVEPRSEVKKLDDVTGDWQLEFVLLDSIQWRGVHKSDSRSLTCRLRMSSSKLSGVEWHASFHGLVPLSITESFSLAVKGEKLSPSWWKRNEYLTMWFLTWNLIRCNFHNLSRACKLSVLEILKLSNVNSFS